MPYGYLDKKEVRVTKQDALVSQWSELSELSEKLGLKAESCDALGQAIKYETDRLEERQSKRIDKLEEQMNQARIALAETDGRIDNIKTSMKGETKLIYEMLSHVSEKIERIESNTSKEQISRRTWLIALVAAVPGLISALIRVIEMTIGK